MSALFGKSQNLPLFLFIAGGFIAGYSFYQRSIAPLPTEAEVANYVEAQYIIEHERMQNAAERPFIMPPEWEAKHKAALREQAVGPHQERRDNQDRNMGIGLIMLVLGTGGLVARITAGKPNETQQ